MHVELVIEYGEPLGRRFVVRPGQRFQIGRGGVTVLLEADFAVSRKHALVELRADNSIWLTDLNSCNGTRLRGERLEPHRPVRANHGDAIHIGGHVLTVQQHEPNFETRRVRRDVLKADESVLLEEEFELLGLIGVGVHGRVYAARQRVIDRRVALKFLHPTSSDRAEVIERFAREGRLACRVRSPYVVEVLDFRIEKNRVYLVMELIDGISLADRLRDSKVIPIPQALHIAAEVALGLSAVHREGVVHQDISPSNILLAPAGIAKLSDFGIATDLIEAGPTTPQEGLHNISYAAPEQITAACAISTSTDIYSLGATLYRMLGGRIPCSDMNGNWVASFVNPAPTPLAELNEACPLEVCHLVERMLDEDPKARPSADRVARELLELCKFHYPAYTINTHKQCLAQVTQTQRFTVRPEESFEPSSAVLDAQPPPTEKLSRCELNSS